MNKAKFRKGEEVESVASGKTARIASVEQSTFPNQKEPMYWLEGYDQPVWESEIKAKAQENHR